MNPTLKKLLTNQIAFWESENQKFAKEIEWNKKTQEALYSFIADNSQLEEVKLESSENNVFTSQFRTCDHCLERFDWGNAPNHYYETQSNSDLCEGCWGSISEGNK